MAVVLQNEISRVKREAIALATKVEESLHDAWAAFTDRDVELAEDVIARDKEIDALEVDVEEECLKVLALHQPVAIDLRLIIAVIKLDNDLERIGDLAVDIAERAVSLAERDPIEIPDSLSSNAHRVKSMVREALDSLVNLDSRLATRVCRSDDEVDFAHRDVFHAVAATIKEQPERALDFMAILSVSRYLERIADHATNIAEDVIYLVEGDIVRHEPEKLKHGRR